MANKQWKYKRRVNWTKLRDKQSDEQCLRTHHRDMPGKYKAKAQKQSAKVGRDEAIYKDATARVMSIQAKGWIVGKCWMRKGVKSK